MPIVTAVPSDTQNRWMRLGEASKRLGVSIDTLRRWIDAGRVPSWRTPTGERRVREDVIDAIREAKA